jgi:hypothetical protein
LPRFEFESRKFQWFYPFTLLSCLENHVCLSYSVQVIGAACAGNDEDCARSKRPDVEDWRWSSTYQVLGGQTIERLGDAVCGLHRAQGDKERGFIG